MIAGVLSAFAIDPDALLRAELRAERQHRIQARATRRHRAHRRWLRHHPGVRALSLARGFLGTPYVWGGAAPGGFDCSGLVQYVYARVGVSLPRTTWSQRFAGWRVSLSRLHVGDLIFAYGYDHVMLYAGGGQVIEAPHTGATVQFAPLSWFPVDEARRVR